MPLNDPVSLGSALRLLRARRSQTQAAVARAAGVTKAMLSAYENGVVFPSIRSLAAVLAALNGDLYALQSALYELDGKP
jgi:transcriptional regulator with XRE-family HTH domain